MPYGYDDLTITWTPDGGSPTDITAYWDMNSAPNTKAKAMIDEYRVAGNAWPKRKDGHGRDYDGKWVLEFVWDPGGTPDLDAIFYDGGDKLGTGGVLEIDYGDGSPVTQQCTIEDYERVPTAGERQTRAKVTFAQDGEPS